MTTTPNWLAAVRTAEERIERARESMAAAGDDRARAVAEGVASYPRGEGRPTVAAKLGVTVGQVDVALRRAREAGPSTGTLHDLADRLLAAELALVEPQPAEVWSGVAQLLQGTFVDSAWIADGGELLAQEAEDADPDELDPVVARQIATATRAWCPARAFAVITAVQSRDLNTLPTLEGI